MFRRIGAACLFAVFVTGAASGATINVRLRGSPEDGLVTVVGPFGVSDIDDFRTKTAYLSKAIVAFSSDGGNLSAGIRIGEMIRVKNYATAVPVGARCASACALAWLGGTRRFMGEGAQIGFHSASAIPSGQPDDEQITSIGNALIGAYLTRIGLPERAVVYITEATPREITWLSLTDAKQQGIEVSLFQPHAPAIGPIAPQPSKRFAGPTSIAETCKADVKQFCADVKPGAGELTACIKSHFKDLSADCQVAFIRVAAVGRDCKSDIKSFCSDAKSKTSVPACLKAHADSLSASCKDAMTKAQAGDK